TTLAFDYSDAGLAMGTAATFGLLRSTDGGSTWSNVGASATVSGDQVKFNLAPGALTDGLYTLGDSSGPILTIAASNLPYAINDPALAIDPGLTLVGTSSPFIASATVTVGGFVNGNADVLAFTPSAGITGSYSTTTGVLTLTGTGTSTPAEFQT